MDFILDNCCSSWVLQKHLQNHGYGYALSRNLLGKKAEDLQIAAYACKHNCIIITADDDFDHIYQSRANGHPGLVYLADNEQGHQPFVACFNQTIKELNRLGMPDLADHRAEAYTNKCSIVQFP